MKNLLTAIFVMVALLFSSVAHADIADDMRRNFQKLTPEQQAAIYQQTVQQANESKTITPTKVAEFADVGATIGKSLAGAARELGVVANDFLKTPVGIFAAAIITWKLIGTDLVHIVGGGLFYFVFLIFWGWSFRKAGISSIEYHEHEVDGKKVKTKRINNTDHEDYAFGYWVAFALGTAVMCAMVFTV